MDFLLLKAVQLSVKLNLSTFWSKCISLAKNSKDLPVNVVFQLNIAQTDST